MRVPQEPAASPVSNALRRMLREQYQGVRAFPEMEADATMRRMQIQGAVGRPNPVTQAMRIEASYGQHPGRAEGGTGTTGLPAGDRRGYHRLLAERRDLHRIYQQLGIV